MCLINFHFQNHPKYKLIVAANRDESYMRPTASARFWEDNPSILAGRDLLQGGTWLGITKNGRFAALTNFRDPSLPIQGQFSRGDIVKQFLAGNIEPLSFIHKLAKSRELYDGFNVIVGNSEQLYHYNNIIDETNEITPGTHSLSNHTLNTPWPKVITGKTMLRDYVSTTKNNMDINPLFDILSNQSVAEDERLPETGVGIDLERMLSPLFIKSSNYGTRSSTVLLIDKENNVTFAERVFVEGKFSEEKRFDFTIFNS